MRSWPIFRFSGPDYGLGSSSYCYDALYYRHRNRKEVLGFEHGSQNLDCNANRASAMPGRRLALAKNE